MYVLLTFRPGSTIPPITPRTSAPEPPTKDQAATEAPDEGVFVTQVDDQEAEQEEEGEEESEPDILSYTASTVNIPDKYKVSGCFIGMFWNLLWRFYFLSFCKTDEYKLFLS